MSVENALAFLSETERSAPLRSRISKLRGAGTMKQLVLIGAESGFYFTEDEYRMAVVQLAQGELSDESIDQVINELRGGRS